ncbi:hypothetical protein PAERUG_E15_London_28_01_14_01581 [Pseudomonas aeruginosa]|nr:hypothetical protein PAERUG_E15_London_28_01_14_01581 [Pseudomonas aeruginosa]
MLLRIALLLLLVASAPAAALDLPALIECRQGVAEQAALAPLLADPLKAVAHGLQPLPQGNQFMSEYRLAQPISVFDVTTERVAVAGASIMAVLDQADPRPLAKRLALEIGYDQDGKFMAGRELVSRDVTDPKTGESQIESIILSVSTVASHPGKTLAGCTYSLDLPEEEAPARPELAPPPITGPGSDGH